MHSIQKQLLELAKNKKLNTQNSLRDIGKKIVGIPVMSAQKVKHHLEQLDKKNLIRWNRKINTVSYIKDAELEEKNSNTFFVNIPVLGAADCGDATLVAEDQCDEFITVSKTLVPGNAKDIFAVKAQGKSMNDVNLNNKNIDDGDYVLIDSSYIHPINNDIVLSVINGYANIKIFKKDPANHRVVLISNSTDEIAPIFIHQDDNYMVRGKVVNVIKKFSLSDLD